MTVRLYGRDVGNGSLATVTRGFRQAFEAAGLLEGVVALDRRGGSEEDEEPAGALARDGVFTGNLNGVRLMQQGARHEHHWVQVTPNSTYVPKDLLMAALQLPNPHLISCSKWGTQQIVDTLLEMGAVGAIDEHGNALVEFLGGAAPVSEVRIHKVHHGVSGFAPVVEELEKTREYYEREFRLIHFSTTDGERKGTLELLRAWNILRNPVWHDVRAKDWARAKLYLVLDHHARAGLEQRMMHFETSMPEGVVLVPRADASPTTMSRLLAHMHLVVCPSRGEGFGLLPLQALASGVPVVATATTGHSAGHLNYPATVIISQSSELFPIDDGPAAQAPAVEPAAIAMALDSALQRWQELSLVAERDAARVARDWSWEQQLAPLVEELR